MERLRFEHEKRQRSIRALQTQIDTLSDNLTKSIQDYSDYACNRWSDEHGENVAQAYRQGQDRLEAKISSHRAELSAAVEEMTAIQQVLDIKWL